jgi:crotonobetainyl-CoA:carnitine CoA-transferase CaiB-like acyl-CoA transferase
MPVDFLQGLRVAVLGESAAAAFAAKLLTDLGAEVWLVEPPGRGHLLRRRRPLLPSGGSGLFEFYARGTRSLTANLDHPDGRELARRFVALTDGVVADRRAWHALDWGAAPPRGRQGGLGVVTVSSRGGEFLDVPANGFVDYHEGGGGYMTPGRVEQPEVEYPIDMALGGQPSMMGGLAAAIALLQAARLAAATGETVWNDVSEQAAVAGLMILNVPWVEYAGMAPRRTVAGGRPTRSTGGFVRVAGGRVAITMIEEHQWDALLRVLGRPEWTDLPVFATQLDRASNWDALRSFLEDEWKDLSADDVMRRCQAENVPVFAVREMAEILASQHEAARGYFSPSEPDGLLLPTNPWRVDGAAVSSAGRAPALGEHTSAALALLGLEAEDQELFAEEGVV